MESNQVVEKSTTDEKGTEQSNTSQSVSASTPARKLSVIDRMRNEMKQPLKAAPVIKEKEADQPLSSANTDKVSSEGEKQQNAPADLEQQKVQDTVPLHILTRERDSYKAKIQKERQIAITERTARLKAERAVELLYKQVQELGSKVKLPPNPADAKLVKVEWENFERDLEPNVKQEFEQRAQKEQEAEELASVSNDLFTRAKQAFEDYDGVISVGEILSEIERIALQEHRIATVEEVAKALATPRIQKVLSKHNQSAPAAVSHSLQPKAPKKAASKMASSVRVGGEPSKEEMLNFVLSQREKRTANRR